MVSRFVSGFLLVLMLALTGCEQTPTAATSPAPAPAWMGSPAPEPAPVGSGSTVLSAGDTIRVTFAVETNLNTVAKIQLDGLVPLPHVGDVPAAGFTVAGLKTDLTERYRRFLKDDEVTVSLAASSASIYVTGSVLRPGKIVMDRPLTALEAIMEAGGLDVRANAASVTVLRLENGRQQTYKVDLRNALRGRDTLPFWLKPFDSVYVPERTFNF